MFNVYAIESVAIKRFYIGHTNNIDARLKYHNSGYVKSTAKDRPWRLVALEKVESKDEARWLERSLKKSRGKRVKWIEKCRTKS
jgi:putative endonuclease